MAIREKEYDSILIIDDHKLLVDGIKLLVGGLFVDVFCFYDGRSGVNTAIVKKPQVIVLDYFLPDMNGELVMRELKYRLPDTKFIMYTYSYSLEIAQKMVFSGVDGYLIKSEDDEELLKALETVMKGSNYYCKEVKSQIYNHLGKYERKKRIIGDVEFSDAEIEIIRLVCKQFTAKEIAKYIYLSERTVEQYRSNILKKTGAQNIGGVIKFAIQTGLIKIEEL